MAIAFVQKDPNATLPVEGSGVAELSTTFDSDTTSGNFLVACVTTWTGGTAPDATLTDNKGNSWPATNPISQLGGGDAARVVIGYAANITGGATHQVTATPGATAYLALGVAEFSGVATSSPVSGTPAGAGDSSSAPSSGATTPTGNALYVGASGYAGASTTLVLNWAGATELHNQPSADISPLASAYYIDSGAETAAWTLGSDRGWAAGIVAFAEAVTGAANVDAVPAEAAADAPAPVVEVIAVVAAGTITSTVTL